MKESRTDNLDGEELTGYKKWYADDEPIPQNLYGISM